MSARKTIFRKIRLVSRRSKMISPLSILQEKKSGIIRTALRYNNLPWVHTIKISRGIHRFAVFTSPRIDFIFHIPPNRRRNHCTYDLTRMRKWSNSFISSTILSSSANLAFHEIRAFSRTFRYFLDTGYTYGSPNFSKCKYFSRNVIYCI